ncbi:polyphenol oxidase, chloroplastic-like [Impatiens glandulifera]|uniref:polyphenol oxidase, chloroplastic-like n=1 Tax=Impatiens glandulifera TaxID=253017 RepID=UPI001FB09575|nr:polyphenol oxidase, chloroplastic-like [Impatiens glandulifera]
MTSFTFPATMPASTTVALSLSFRLPSSNKTPQSHTNHYRSYHKLNVKCKMNQPGELDRRDVLIGLGGLYTASNLPQPALADPVLAPDLTQCGAADLPEGANPVNCCPPSVRNKIVPFKLPPPTRLRIRPASHLVDKKYVEKFERAVRLMKALPSTDPRSFYQQANIHCAYCDGAYDQVNYPGLELQVHNSWLFFPWHRYYLYFFEKILGKLIDDPTFAMPFWNWDNPAGMPIPAIYSNPNSPLYDPLRDPLHQPPTLVNFNYDGTDPTSTNEEQISDNLALMYKQMISNGKKANSFLGEPYRAGSEADPGGGSIENSPHGPVHGWTGDRNQPNGENMGNFYSAGRDPIFMAHHSNIDRLWAVWNTLGGRRRNFTDTDWLNTSFAFYDENAQLVEVKVRDCLDEKRLGYTFQTVPNLWLGARPKPTTRTTTLQSREIKIPTKTKTTTTTSEATTPIVLDKKPVTVKVIRPKQKKRSKKEKEEEEEVLLIEGIELDKDSFVKFDVLVNDEDDGATFTGPNKAEFAGTFVNVPHLHKEGKKMKIKTCLRLGITDLLEDLDVEDDDSVLVTIVPKRVTTTVTIASIKIVFE